MIVEVVLGFFSLEGNPLLGGKCIAAMYDFKYLYSERRDYERKKRKLHWVCCRLYPFICWIIIKEGPNNSLVDVTHTRCVVPEIDSKAQIIMSGIKDFK
jgi:hypothetical protein